MLQVVIGLTLSIKRPNTSVSRVRCVKRGMCADFEIAARRIRALPQESDHLRDPNRWRLGVISQSYLSAGQYQDKIGENEHNAHPLSEEAEFEPIDPESHALSLENAIF